MTRRIRVLIVDDSVVVRRAVSDMLAKDPDVEVIATASNGKIGIDRVTQLEPDLVILDVEMPEMDGIEALRRLQALRPKLPVLMFSALTERGAALTLDALAHGARDYVTKPTSLGHRISLEHVEAELLSKAKALVTFDAKSSLTPRVVAKTEPKTGLTVAQTGLEAVVIAASTGGPNALADVLASVPRGLPVPILIVQHMPPVFTKIFAERLSAQLGLDVVEATDGELAGPGRVLVAPGDYHMSLHREGASLRVATHQSAPENSCRPAADVLFRSAAKTLGASVLGVVLTGMGQDGLRGSMDIRAAGGQVIVQDEASSVVWSMPGSVAKADLANAIVPLADVGMEIVRRVMRDRARSGAEVKPC